MAAAAALGKLAPAAADAVPADKRLHDRDPKPEVRDAAAKAVYLIQAK